MQLSREFVERLSDIFFGEKWIGDSIDENKLNDIFSFDEKENRAFPKK